MARRSDHSRDELYELTLEAARKIAEQDGLRGLASRRVARDIGYTVGTIYNLFEDLDDLIVHLNGRTLDDMYEALAKIPLADGPENSVRALATGYIAFARGRPKLWSVLFEHHLPEPRQLPDWQDTKIHRLFGLLEQALEPLFPPDGEAERRHAARVLWAGLHGICALESLGKLAAAESAETMADTLVTCFLAGLRSVREG